MNIVILHCHFERGGVTQVVENQIRFLAQRDDVDNIFLISGNRIGGLSSQTLAKATHLCVDAMDYDTLVGPSGTLIERADELSLAITKALSTDGVTADNGVLHWHNHSLGKNVAAPAVIQQLANTGWRFLLQVHDFAEDNRPQNYSQLLSACGATSTQQIDQYLYPTAGTIHYASLTRADLNVFTHLGLDPARTHCLPNSVSTSDDDAARKGPDQEASLIKVRAALGLPADSRWCVYPVRGIRRKNVGEFLLLSRLLPTNRFAGITLRPATPIEAQSYDRWRSLAANVAPRAVFDAGHHETIRFAENIAATDFVISTSVAEGFGMVYLEPWLMHRAVIARNLPTVTSDFQADGVEFPILYDSVAIPGEKDWIAQCIQEHQAAAQSAFASLPSAFRPSAVATDSSDGTIDFALLTPKRQTTVLQRMAQDDGFEKAVRQHNETLCQHLATVPPSELVERNRTRVSEVYSTNHQGERLMLAYHAVTNGPRQSPLRTPEQTARRTPEQSATQSAIDCVSAVRPFFPCRTEDPIDA